MASLYQLIPPSPTWADLAGVCDRGLELASTIPGVTQPGILGTITGWFTGSGQTDATSRSRVETAAQVLAEVKGQAADNPTTKASGEAVARVRQACITLEQETAGMVFESNKQERNRAELLDDVTNPEAYVGVAKAGAIGGFAPAALAEAEGSVAAVKDWFGNNKLLLGGAAVVVVLFIILAVRSRQ